MTEVQKRIFVGNVLNNGEECFADLYKRFGTFGTLASGVTGFDCHGTFGYLDVTFTDEQQYQKLKRSFNNLSFKGNTLRVDVAKPSFQETWEAQQARDAKASHKLAERNAKRNWEHYKKIENIEMSWRDRRDVMPGRMRVKPRNRREMSQITFRIDVNGSLKVYKCYKTKLWGYERNKELGDLVARFSGNKWWNGFDHIVDRLNYARSRSSVKLHDRASGTTLTVTHEADKEEDSGEDDYEGHNAAEEREKNSGVLSSLLSGFDFDKTSAAVDSDDAEEFGFNEQPEQYEEQYEGQYKGQYNNDQYNNDQYNEQYNENQYNDKYNENQYNEQYNNQYNENQYDEYNEQYNEHKEKQKPHKTVVEDEPIPVFTDKPVNNVVTGTISNTDTLRSLFNPETPQTGGMFQLGANDDIDVDQNKAEPVDASASAAVAAVEIAPLEIHGPKKHLFFAHFRSPFLQGQTQLAHIASGSMATDPLLNWDDQFWEQRGAWTREMKHKRRDALRHQQRKRTRDGARTLI